MKPDLDLDHLRSWIGRTERAEDIVTPRLAAEYEATLGPNLMPVGEGEAPLALHWCLAPPIAPMAALGADGHPARGGFLPPVPLPRRMWAGGAVEQTRLLRIGEGVARTSRIEDVAIKTGRTGSLCFVTVRHELAGEHGPALTERQDIVYRDASSAGPKPDSTPAGLRDSDLSWTVEASPTLLFRYSAMTFNGHRIHYDEPYVTGSEGYDGLVVHGPMQASLLFNLAATRLSRMPARFEYRGVSPMTAGRSFRAGCAGQEDGTLACWTDLADGRVCMEASAS